MVTLTREPVRLSTADTQALRRAVEQQRPEFAARLAAGGLVTEQIGQPWFGRHRIVEVMSGTHFPAVGIHVAFASDGRCGVLTGTPAALAAVVQSDPPPRLDDPDEVMAYANVMDAWTTVSPLGELVVGSLDEVPWFDDLGDVEELLLDDLRQAVGAEIALPAVSVVDPGFVVVKWLVSAAQLIRRELHVGRDGRFERRDEIVDSELPVPPGRVWGMVHGRLVPTG